MRDGLTLHIVCRLPHRRVYCRSFLLLLFNDARHFLFPHDEGLVDVILVDLVHITTSLIGLFLEYGLNLLRLVAHHFLRYKQQQIQICDDIRNGLPGFLLRQCEHLSRHHDGTA